MKPKVALITEITGQDGAYLAEFLLAKGYVVHGIKRRTSLFNTQRIDHLYQDPHDPDPRLLLHFGDMTDSSSLTRIVPHSQEEKGYDAQGRCIVAIDPRYFRPAEVETLLGDASKARAKLGWQPRIAFNDLVAEMVRHDLHEAERSRLVKDHGYVEHDRHA